MFVYCLNNPVRYVDVTGFLAQSAIDLDGDNNDIFDPDAGGVGGAGSSSHLGPTGGTGGTSVTSNKSSIKDLLKAVGCFFDQLLKNLADGIGGLTGVIRTQPNTDLCFVAGTLIHAEDGAVPIEDIKENDYVWAWDEETGTITLKKVVETYINQTDELLHIFVCGEEIVTTPEHPFYSPVKGWTKAAHLRAGDILVLVNGDYVIVEKVQHEILESPVTVYNFHVEDYHTYYVADIGVLVHNSCNHNSAWDAERRNYWTSEGHKYAAENANGQASQSGTYLVTTDNINLMLMGYAPFGIDGKKVQLHHAKGIANDFYDYYEITATNHRSNFKMLHGYLYK